VIGNHSNARPATRARLFIMLPLLTAESFGTLKGCGVSSKEFRAINGFSRKRPYKTTHDITIPDRRALPRACLPRNGRGCHASDSAMTASHRPMTMSAMKYPPAIQSRSASDPDRMSSRRFASAAYRSRGRDRGCPYLRTSRN
jgi:hypothetical protein